MIINSRPKTPIDLSIVIACYKDALHLEKNVRRIDQIIRQTTYNTEYIFVDDCGQDGAVEIIKKLVSEFDNAQMILHESNTGRGKAVSDGFAIAKGEVAGFLDIDLAVSPVYIPQMVASIRDDGYDVATAHRVYLRNFDPFSLVRDVVSDVYSKMVQTMLSLDFQDTETGYKFFRRSALLDLLEKAEETGWFWDTEIMALSKDAGLKVIEHRCLFVRDSEKMSTVVLARDIPAYFTALRAFQKRR